MTDPVYSYSPTFSRDDSILRRFIKHFDWVLLFDVLFLSVLGLVMIYSASSRFGHPEFFLGKQIGAFVLGWITLFILSTINYQIF